jgi:RNA-binding protein 26
MDIFIGPGVTSVDRRPSKILVSGFELDDKHSVIEHFNKFGEILNTVYDDVTPSVIIHFKTRRFAEQALAGGKHYGDRDLAISW